MTARATLSVSSICSVSSIFHHYFITADGTEASHQHWEGDLNCDRGYEWLILEGAKARNPAIKTYGLSWAWPRWVGGGGSTPWDDVAKSSNYTLNWLKCARSKGIPIDYIGSWK